MYLIVAPLVSNVKKSDEVFYNHDETAISELRRVQQSGVSKLITVEIRFIIVFTRFIKLDGRSGKNFQHVDEQCGILYSMDKFFGLKRLKRKKEEEKFEILYAYIYDITTVFVGKIRNVALTINFLRSNF